MTRCRPGVFHVCVAISGVAGSPALVFDVPASENVHVALDGSIPEPSPSVEAVASNVIGTPTPTIFETETWISGGVTSLRLAVSAMVGRSTSSAEASSTADAIRT